MYKCSSCVDVMGKCSSCADVLGQCYTHSCPDVMSQCYSCADVMCDCSRYVNVAVVPAQWLYGRRNNVYFVAAVT